VPKGEPPRETDNARIELQAVPTGGKWHDAPRRGMNCVLTNHFTSFGQKDYFQCRSDDSHQVKAWGQANHLILHT
jgi:hypothetical protein